MAKLNSASLRTKVLGGLAISLALALEDYCKNSQFFRLTVAIANAEKHEAHVVQTWASKIFDRGTLGHGIRRFAVRMLLGNL